MATYDLAAIRFRSYLIEEDEATGPDGVPISPGGGGGGGDGTINFYDAGAGPGGSDPGVSWSWFGVYGDGLGSDAIVPDTWQHVVATYHNNGDGTAQHKLVVDGVTQWDHTVSGASADPPTAAVYGCVFWTMDPAWTGPAMYIDTCMATGFIVDDFEAGDLSAWQAVVGGCAITTDQAYAGSHSLACTPDVDGNAYVWADWPLLTNGTDLVFEMRQYIPSAEIADSLNMGGSSILLVH